MLGWLFLGVAVGILALFVMQIGSFNALAPPPPVTEPQASGSPMASQPQEVVVKESHFTGFDKDRQPYTVTARTAVQDEKDIKKVHLTEVGAQLKRLDGGDIGIKSKQALFDSESKRIDLTGNVEITVRNGLTASMSKATVELQSQSLKTDVPVTVVDDKADIAANGLEISDDGKRILFFNGVKAKFRGSAGKGDTQQ
jgi:lipopolysaccharide export system protein LptC